jgi:hypothetical protein
MVADHHIGINGWLASHVTDIVGTMWCAYAFVALSFYGLPAALAGGPGGFVQWASSQFIQLVLLPVIIVAQKVQGDAADARSVATYHDTEVILDRLDAHTEGGIKAILDKLEQSKL